MQPSSIPWELIWRAFRVGLLAVLSYLTAELQPLVVQGDTPVRFSPGLIATLVGLLGAAEAVYAALKRFGILKTKDVPAVKAVFLGQPVFTLPQGSLVDVTVAGDKSRKFIDPFAVHYRNQVASIPPFNGDPTAKPPFSGPLHDPKDDTPQAAD